MTADFEKQLEKKVLRWAKVMLAFHFLAGYIALNLINASPELLYVLGFVMAAMGVRAAFNVMKMVAKEAVKDEPD